MIRKFEILDEKHNDELSGYLSYDTEKDFYTMRILEDYTGKHPHVLFRLMHEQGIVDVPDFIALDWVQSRVIPPNRHGIWGILADIGMTEYNVFDLLMYSMGRCDADNLYLKEISDDKRR